MSVDGGRLLKKDDVRQVSSLMIVEIHAQLDWKILLPVLELCHNLRIEFMESIPRGCRAAITKRGGKAISNYSSTVVGFVRLTRHRLEGP